MLKDRHHHIEGISRLLVQQFPMKTSAFLYIQEHKNWSRRNELILKLQGPILIILIPWTAMLALLLSAPQKWKLWVAINIYWREFLNHQLGLSRIHHSWMWAQEEKLWISQWCPNTTDWKNLNLLCTRCHEVMHSFMAMFHLVVVLTMRVSTWETEATVSVLQVLRRLVHLSTKTDLYLNMVLNQTNL